MQGRLVVARYKYIIKIIPCANPWGYDNDKRWNSNGVNTIRNFDANWSLHGTAFSDNYSGPSAASEDETKVIQAWIDNNQNAIALIDYHNSSFSNEVSYISGSNAVNAVAVIKNGYRKCIDNIIGYWKTKRGMTASDAIYGYTGFITTGGMTQIYGQTQGIPSLTMESSWNQNGTGKHSNFTIGVGAEALSCVIQGIPQST